MKTPAAELTPFVRSDAVGALLAETLGHPSEEFTLAELGRRTGVAGSVVHREVSRLVESDILVDRYEGRNRLIRANDQHPLFSLMRDLVAATYGPVPVLRAEFEGLRGARKVLIYGSWAARRVGEPGPYPNDLDVLVVGDVPRRKLIGIATRASERLGLEVNVTRVSAEEWEAADRSPFVSTVRSRPLIDVRTGARHDATA